MRGPRDQGPFILNHTSRWMLCTELDNGLVFGVGLLMETSLLSVWSEFKIFCVLCFPIEFLDPTKKQTCLYVLLIAFALFPIVLNETHGDHGRNCY